MYAVDSHTYSTYRNGSRHGSTSQWGAVDIDTIAEPSAEWLNHVIQTINESNPGVLVARAVRITDQVAREYAYNLVSDEQSHLHSTVRRYPDIPQLWACPIAIRVMWDSTYLDHWETRPPLNKMDASM